VLVFAWVAHIVVGLSIVLIYHGRRQEVRAAEDVYTWVIVHPHPPALPSQKSEREFAAEVALGPEVSRDSNVWCVTSCD
jgi:hypothetical protein